MLKNSKCLQENMGLQQSLQKEKNLRGQIRTKHEDKMETSAVVCELDRHNCLKTYTGETGRKLKEKMKEHKDDEEKS